MIYLTIVLRIQYSDNIIGRGAALYLGQPPHLQVPGSIGENVLLLHVRDRRALNIWGGGI